LLAEQLGQAAFKLRDPGVHAGGAFLGGEQVGLQGGTADCWPAAVGTRRRGFQAVVASMRAVEVRARRPAGPGNDAIGVDLMTKAFGPSGRLTGPRR